MSLRGLFFRPGQSFIILLVFFANTIGPIPQVKADEFRLPAPGVMVYLSPVFNPPVLKGIKVHPDNPFRFDFILDKGDSQLSNDALKDESSRLIKYFLASLTIPEKDLWVNLSPYEKNRIVPESFGQTEMGRDLLAEDYMLKQVTASLIYPEGEIGKKFWKRIYEEVTKRFGTTNIPVNTFNKVWIVPEKAVVYENAKAGTAYVVESKLKVMLEQDYLALSHNVIPAKAGIQNTSALGSQIVREIVIPELTKEVNENKNFSQLRQIYNSLILATWYKNKIKDCILEQVYADKKKVAGVNIDDPQETQKIYQRYLQAFKKGVYNYIKEEQDPVTQETIPRKYFSGGVLLNMTILKIDSAMIILHQWNMPSGNDSEIVNVRIDPAMSASLEYRDGIVLYSQLQNGQLVISKEFGLIRIKKSGDKIYYQPIFFTDYIATDRGRGVVPAEFVLNPASDSFYWIVSKGRIDYISKEAYKIAQNRGQGLFNREYLALKVAFEVFRLRIRGLSETAQRYQAILNSVMPGTEPVESKLDTLASLLKQYEVETQKHEEVLEVIRTLIQRIYFETQDDLVKTGVFNYLSSAAKSSYEESPSFMFTGKSVSADVGYYWVTELLKYGIANLNTAESNLSLTSYKHPVITFNVLFPHSHPNFIYDNFSIQYFETKKNVEAMLQLADKFSEKVIRALSVQNLKPDLIIGVPRLNGQQNQLDPLLMVLSEKSHISVGNSSVVKIDRRREQKLVKGLLNKALNVIDAYEIKDLDQIRGKTILLVDDHWGTGFTSTEIRRKLLDAGAKEVIIVTLSESVPKKDTELEVRINETSETLFREIGIVQRLMRPPLVNKWVRHAVFIYSSTKKAHFETAVLNDINKTILDSIFANNVVEEWALLLREGLITQSDLGRRVQRLILIMAESMLGAVIKGQAKTEENKELIKELISQKPLNQILHEKGQDISDGLMFFEANALLDHFSGNIYDSTDGRILGREEARANMNSRSRFYFFDETSAISVQNLKPDEAMVSNDKSPAQEEYRLRWIEHQGVHILPIGETFDGGRILRQLVTDARRSILIDMYSFHDNSVWDLLKQKAIEGIEVKVIIGKNVKRLTKKQSELIQSIQKEEINNLQIIFYRPERNRQFVMAAPSPDDHKKLIIIDGQYVYIGCDNLSFFRGRTAGLIVHSIHGLKEFEDIFWENWYWAHGQRYAFRATKNPWGQILRERSIEDNTRFAYIQEILKAKKRIYISQWHLNDDLIVQVLKMKLRNDPKIDIRVLLNGVEKKFQLFPLYIPYVRSLPAYDKLQSSSVPVRWSNPKGLFDHRKLLIADNTVITGSSDLTPRAYYGNQELGIRLENSQLAEYFSKIFIEDWGVAENRDGNIQEKITSYFINWFSRKIQRANTFIDLYLTDFSETTVRWYFFLIGKASRFIKKLFGFDLKEFHEATEVLYRGVDGEELERINDRGELMPSIFGAKNNIYTHMGVFLTTSYRKAFNYATIKTMRNSGSYVLTLGIQRQQRLFHLNGVGEKEYEKWVQLNFGGAHEDLLPVYLMMHHFDGYYFERYPSVSTVVLIHGRDLELLKVDSINEEAGTDSSTQGKKNVIDQNGFIDGSVYEEQFIKNERTMSRERPTVVFDMDHTILDKRRTFLGSVSIIRPGIIDELNKLKTMGYRLVLWTRSPKKAVRKYLLSNSEMYGLFELIITGDNGLSAWNPGVSNSVRKEYYQSLFKKYSEKYNEYKPIGLFKYRLLVDDKSDIFGGASSYVIKPFLDNKVDTEPIDQLANRIDAMVKFPRIEVTSHDAWKELTDGAMTAKGGIDLTPANMNLQTQNSGSEIRFHLDPAMLQQLQNAPGFVPVIINIQPLKSLSQFLGLTQSTTLK